MSRQSYALTIPSPWKGENAWEWFWVLETGAVAVAFAFHSVTSDWTWWQRAAGIAGAALFAAFTWLQARAILRPTFRRDARIEIDPSGLLIKDNNLFEEPLRIELSRIRLATLDPGPDKKHRFPIEQPLGNTPKEDGNSYLWQKDKAGALPTDAAHHADEVPNMALLLNTPIQLRGRRDVRTFLTKPQYFVNRYVRVVTLSVDDLTVARSAFDALGLVRRPTGQDITACEPSPDEKRQLRKLERIQWVGLTVTVIAFFGIPIVYIASTS